MTASDGQLATLGGRLKQLKENMKHHDAGSRASGSVSAADDVRPLSSNLSARSGRDTLHSRTSQQPQPQAAQQPAMSAEESEGWIQALLNCDDVSAAVEEMTHVRNVSPIRGHRSTSTAARQSYVPASPLARQQGGRKPVLPASDYGVKPQQQQQQQRRPAEQQAQPRQQSAFVAAPAEPHRSASPPASAADDALDKAAKIMSDLQHLAAWTGYDASQALPPPPKGVALPAPVTTLLPQQQPQPQQQQQPQPFQHQQQPLPPPQAPAFQASLPDPLGSARQPRPLEPGAYNPRYTDSPAEDKWLRSAQQLRGRSLDHPERGRSAGQQSASSRLPSPSPASLAEAPPVNRPSAVPPSPGHAAWELDPKQPVWDGRGGSRAGGSVASDFNATPNGLDELTARTGRSSAPHGAPRLNGGVGGGGSVGGASNVDGRLAAPPISGPGSRAESPAGGAAGLGPRSSSQSSRATRTDLQTRLTQQKADIRSAIDTEFRMHESNVKSLLQGVTDSARNTPLPVPLDPPVENKRRSPPRSRASSVNRPPRPLDAATPVPRAPVHDTPVSVHLSPSGRDESVSAISDSRLDHRFAPPAQAGHATPSTTLLQHSDPTTAHADGSALPSAGPGGGGGSGGGGSGSGGASATGSTAAAQPRDDWLTKPLQDPYGNEAGLRADSLASGPPPAGAPLPPPAPVAAATASGQSQARAPSPARWGSRDPPDSLPTGTHTSVVPLARAPSPAASNRSPTGMSMAGASPLLRPGSPGTIPVADGLGSPRREYPDEFNLTVLIDGELGAGVAIRARHSDSIATLKAKVQENRPSIPLEQQRLLYQGREMEDSLKVCDYALGEATPLQLLLKPLGSASQADDEELAADAAAAAAAAAAPVEDPNKGKQVWLTTKGNGGVVKITVAKGDREGELMYRAKRKLDLSPDKDYHAVANGRRVRLSHETVKEGFVYTLEEAPHAAADAAAGPPPPLPAARSGSNGTGVAEGGLDYRATTTTPQSLGPAADPLLPPPAPPQSGAYRLRQLYGSIQKDPVTRGDVHEALMRAAGSLDQILNVDDSLPADADVRRTLAAFAGDPRQPVRFSALVREVMSHQARCELAEECWDDQKPWQLVSVGSAVVPVDTIPAKHRYLLDMGVGRVVALNFTVVSAQKPAIPVARVLFRSGTQDATEWVKLMNLRAAKGPVATEAPQMPPTTSLGITASTATSRVPQAQQPQQQQQQQPQQLQQQHLQQQQFQQQPMTPQAGPQTLPPPGGARQGRPGSRPTSPLSVYRAASPGGGRSPVRGQTPTGQNASRGTTPDGRGRSRGTLASQTLASLRVRSRSASAGERQPNQQMSNLMAQVLEKRRMQQGSVAAGQPPQHYQRMPSGGRGSQASGRPPQQQQGAMQPQRVRSVSRNRMNP